MGNLNMNYVGDFNGDLNVVLKRGFYCWYFHMGILNGDINGGLKGILSGAFVRGDTVCVC